MNSMETSPTIAAPAFWNDLEFEPATGAVREQRPRRPAAGRAARATAPWPVTETPVPAETVQASTWTLSSFRRVLDFLVAAVALTILFPLLGIIAVCVRLSSPGPIIFRQQRVGRVGELFTIYKFRTMEAAPKRKGLSVTRHGDQRITRVGSFLRKYKLDELPQLVNVLFGDMSLVGPRPKLPDHTDLHVPFRPGITGAATLVFRREEEMLKHVPEHELEAFCLKTLTPYKAKLDFEYAQEATLASDLRLLYRTAEVCLRRSKSELPEPKLLA